MLYRIRSYYTTMSMCYSIVHRAGGLQDSYIAQYDMISVSLHIYIYIYTHTYIYTHMCVYIYIYIYKTNV